MTDVSVISASRSVLETAPRRVAAAPSEKAAAILERPDISIDRDEVTGDFIYRFIDKKTGELIDQWPSEEIIALKRAIGRLFDERA